MQTPGQVSSSDPPKKFHENVFKIPLKLMVIWRWEGNQRKAETRSDGMLLFLIRRRKRKPELGT